MAEPRSSIYWLQKSLPKLQQAVEKVAGYKPTSKQRISAERKLANALARIQELEASLASQPEPAGATPLRNSGSPELEDTTKTNVDAEAADSTSTIQPLEETPQEQDEPDTTDADLTNTTNPPKKTSENEAITETVGTSGEDSEGAGLPNIDKAEGATDDVNALLDESKPDSPSTGTNPMGVSGMGLTTEPNQPNQSIPSASASHIDELTIPQKSTTPVHGLTPEELAELKNMYSAEPANDYDIDEYVQKFSTDEDIYAEYAAEFEKWPALNAPEIHAQVLHALPGFDSLSVKMVSTLRWDEMHSTDKICLSILGRVAIRRFVDAYKTDQNATLSPNWVKVFARSEPRFLPEAATTSAPVALAFLRMQNLPEIRCRFHHSERHDERHAADTLNHLTGCAFPPPDTGEKKPKRTGKGKGKKAIEAAPARKDDHLDCGCSLVDALEDWFHYKTARLSSTNPRIRKTFPIQGVISPIERASLLTALRSPVHVPLRLRYTGVNGWPALAGQWITPNYKLELMRKTRALVSITIQQLETDFQLVSGASGDMQSATPNADDPEGGAAKRAHNGTELDDAGNQSKKLRAE